VKATVAAGRESAGRGASAPAEDRGAVAVSRPAWGPACAAAWLLIASASLAAAPQPDRQEPFPATVKVSADHTYLRAGPGDDFYPTERLVAGTDVEVWSIDPAGSGYVAVRPVVGGFSWLRACDVDTAAAGESPARDRGIGVIVTDGAVSRVGSQLNDLRHVAQVTLEAGERVRVLEEVRIASGRHAGLWVRIEPPAGEFRWARLADLEPPPGLVAAPAALADTDAEAAAARATLGEAVAALKDAGVALAQAVGDNGTATVSQAAASPAAAAVPAAQPPTAVPPPQELGLMPSAKRLFAGWLPRGTSIFDPAAPISPVAVTAAGPATGAGDELADIDLALSLAVTGPAESWNLAPVRERLRQVAARTGNDAERARIAAIDARIARFEAIQGRHRTLQAATGTHGAAPLQIGGMWSSLSSIGSRPIRPGVLPGGAPADGQPTWTPPDMTETTGRLATVVSRRPDAPRWAVVDQSNNVIAFITPQTGVNLAPLVGQDVTVRGARGYMPEYKRPYVVAAEARTRMAAAPDATPDRAVR